MKALRDVTLGVACLLCVGRAGAGLPLNDAQLDHISAGGGISVTSVAIGKGHSSAAAYAYSKGGKSVGWGRASTSPGGLAYVSKRYLPDILPVPRIFTVTPLVR